MSDRWAEMLEAGRRAREMRRAVVRDGLASRVNRLPTCRHCGVLGHRRDHCPEARAAGLLPERKPPKPPRVRTGRAHSESTITMRRHLRIVDNDNAEDGEPLPQRPRTRGDCEGVPRPCPFVSCSQHLYLEVNPSSGTLKLNFPNLEPDQMAESCTLDIADRDGETLETIGAAMNLTRERIRQLETMGLEKAIRAASRADVEIHEPHESNLAAAQRI